MLFWILVGLLLCSEILNFLKHSWGKTYYKAPGKVSRCPGLTNHASGIESHFQQRECESDSWQCYWTGFCWGKLELESLTQISSVSLINTSLWYSSIQASLYSNLKLRVLVHICSVVEKRNKWMCHSFYLIGLSMVLLSSYNRLSRCMYA